MQRSDFARCAYIPGNSWHDGALWRLADLAQAHGPEVVFINTSGGLTGGDMLSYRLDLGRDTGWCCGTRRFSGPSRKWG